MINSPAGEWVCENCKREDEDYTFELSGLPSAGCARCGEHTVLMKVTALWKNRIDYKNNG